MDYEAFKILQKQWYRKLADSGFRDIEADGEPSFRNINQTKIETDEAYFEILSMLVHHEQTLWKREIDRRIMTLYADGVRINDICHALRVDGDSRGRAAIRFIIRKYEHAWMIRNYTRKQMHLRTQS